jgi:predicted transposase YbfD/YdcC
LTRAWGCQRDIAARIIGKRADDILALKGNQGTPRDDVEALANERKTRGFRDASTSVHTTIDANHGRVETRTYTAIHHVGWLKERHTWPGLKGVIMVESQRETARKTERETRFYITSLALEARLSGPMIRDHWAVENGLHRIMDMTSRHDECRIRTGQAPANFTTLRHMAHNLYRKAPGKDSIRLRCKTAAWDDDFLVSLIAA